MALIRSVVATGILTGVLLSISVWMHAPAWVAFLIWTGQGMLHRSVGATWFMLPGFCVGTLMASASVFSARELETAPSISALPVTLGAACAAVALLSAWRRTEPAVAPVFLGMIAWFGSDRASSAPSIAALLGAAALGITAHQITVFVQTITERRNCSH